MDNVTKERKNNSGRKPMKHDQKKGQVRLYPTNYEIELLGGEEALKEKIMQFIKEEVDREKLEK